MNSFAQSIIDKSKVEISLIRITNATADTFLMTIDSETTNIGPLSASLEPMTVDLAGEKGPFGKLILPGAKTSSQGTRVEVRDQLIQITDLNAYLAFSKCLQLDKHLTLHLSNGKGVIKTWVMKACIDYNKKVSLDGMNGPQVTIRKTELIGQDGFRNEMVITNPSPVEIDMGTATYELRNAAGVTLATQEANVFILRGETVYEAVGKVVAKGDVESVFLVGVPASKEGTWLMHTLEWYNVPVILTSELKTLLSAPTPLLDNSPS